ncbi:MAG: GC-type dockerin domain-anchored protein [Planctomycetota bacterium]
MQIRTQPARPAAAVAMLALAGLPLGAAAQGPLEDEDTPVMLQWFEQRWNTMEHRVPDFFAFGYGALWLPPVSETFDPASPGYDAFDRFNIGEPGNETAYGTEDDFGAAIAELQNAGGEVYVDAIFNHNSGRQTSASFQSAGGWPGFWMGPFDSPFKQPTDDWGDFHGGSASGYFQSENPGAPLYNLLQGDLVALVDINQSSNNQFIRQPVDALDPDNIPAGSVRNLPDPANARFYPDTSLGGTVVNNPLGPSLTFFDFNSADEMAGDAVLENATGYLMRWARWMMQVQGIDGFRLDALKHTDTFFWDQFFDSAVHMQRTTPDGRQVNPFTFGESTTDNGTIAFQLTRKDSFANRDSLDLSGAGSLRNLKSGVGDWSTPIFNSHLDNADDGFNNGSLGVNHVFSHDNGSQGDGGSSPAFPNARDMAFPQTAYVLLRPGWPIVYHNARQIARGSGFFPRAGYSNALGWDPVAGTPDDTVTTLVQIRNQYGRGFFIPLNGTDPVNTSDDDVFVFERRTPTGGANMLIGVSDVYAGGFQTRNVQTSYDPGTILHELTGNASDPDIDPGGVVPDTLTVDGSGRVTIVVPNNSSVITNHEKGYVVYGEIVPDATLTIPESTRTILGDPTSVNPGARRITDVPIIDTPTFTIAVATSQADPNDPNTDDGALFRINQGFQDLNGNGTAGDIPYTDTYSPGFEAFLTVNQPLFGSGGSAGTYEQVISTADLEEGYNYILVRVFRHRSNNDAPLYRELRLPVFVDLESPSTTFVGGDQTVESSTFNAVILADDRTTNRVNVHLNLAPGDDPIAESNALNQATFYDRFEFRRTITGLQPGANTVTIVAFEDDGSAAVTEYTLTFGEVNDCIADLSTTGATLPGQTGFGIPDGNVDLDDLGYYLSFWLEDFVPVADLTTAGATLEGQPGFGVPDGSVDLDDLGYFLNFWLAGCP